MDRSGNASISNRTMPGDGILVMGDENAILCPRKPEHFGIGSTVESGREGALKISARARQRGAGAGSPAGAPQLFA
jgi:hypothetical protein